MDIFEASLNIANGELAEQIIWIEFSTGHRALKMRSLNVYILLFGFIKPIMHEC